jgi:ATP-dependent DNA helicase DinG
VAFHSAPLDVADDLRERVLRRYRSVVMTSATLTVEREFDHFLSQIGATDPGRLSLAGSPSRDGRSSRRRRLETLLLDSPFDYDRQVYVGAPIDLPSPQEEPFGDALVEFLLRTLTISRGRGLVLFTSYRMLEETFAKAAPRLEAAGYACLKQGAAGRSLLTETFRRDVSSILFATSSFWEGVDVPGEALSCLVLARLPFSVPNEPILEARVERLKAQGIEPFEAFIVPRAVIRFRQGFGRLIRTRDDRGAVLVADRRVASAGYGIKFLNSLPTRKRTLAPQKEVIEGLARFFADESS